MHAYVYVDVCLQNRGVCVWWSPKSVKWVKETNARCFCLVYEISWKHKKERNFPRVEKGMINRTGRYRKGVRSLRPTLTGNGLKFWSTRWLYPWSKNECRITTSMPRLASIPKVFSHLKGREKSYIRIVFKWYLINSKQINYDIQTLIFYHQIYLKTLKEKIILSIEYTSIRDFKDYQT
jgi:hypothetical protein